VVEIGHDLNCVAPGREPLALHPDAEPQDGDVHATGLLPELGCHLRIAATIGDKDEVRLLQCAKVRRDQLQVNAYRVLLTRARDVSVVYVPRLAELDETYEHLGACGIRPLARD